MGDTCGNVCLGGRRAPAMCQQGRLVVVSCLGRGDLTELSAVIEAAL